MTPAELASAAEIEQAQLEALEAGRLALADDLLRALTAALDIDANVLSGGFMDTPTVRAAFGRRLRKLREARGLSQEELGRNTSLNRTSIQKLEAGERDPRLTTIRLLALGLRVPPRELIEWDAG
jgi:DNA-binding XRE family transcriptional regulator